MSVSSSSSNDPSPLPPYRLSSNRTVNVHRNACFRMEVSLFVFSASSFASFLLLPFFILDLYFGFLRWRQQRSVSTAAVSHSDLFIYHSIIMQLISLFGSNCCFGGGYMDFQELMMGGFCVCSVTTVGQTLFQILTSVERYLAVVYPITYRTLRQMDKVRIRNVTIGCVWLASFGWLLVSWLSVYEVSLIVNGCSIGVSLVVVSLCSVSALCALKRPGPGTVGGHKERGDRSKRRAFHTMVVILGVLLIRFTGTLMINVVYSLGVVEQNNYCVALICLSWVDFPSSLVLPLLFLQRMGKLRRSRHSPDK